jgi:NAD(P)-dependent dehydrogenase (short-subunit alcohol dehydrogenase family)
MVAVVTGGASGMGRATALLFAREGARVVVGDVDAESGASLEAEARAAGGEIAFRRCDVSVEADVAALVGLAESRFGKLDTIFNNAGIEQPVTASDAITEDAVRHASSTSTSRGPFLAASTPFRH